MAQFRFTPVQVAEKPIAETGACSRQDTEPWLGKHSDNSIESRSGPLIEWAKVLAAHNPNSDLVKENGLLALPLSSRGEMTTLAYWNSCRHGVWMAEAAATVNPISSLAYIDTPAGFPLCCTLPYSSGIPGGRALPRVKHFSTSIHRLLVGWHEAGYYMTAVVIVGLPQVRTLLDVLFSVFACCALVMIASASCYCTPSVPCASLRLPQNESKGLITSIL